MRWTSLKVEQSRGAPDIGSFAFNTCCDGVLGNRHRGARGGRAGKGYVSFVYDVVSQFDEWLADAA